MNEIYRNIKQHKSGKKRLLIIAALVVLAIVAGAVVYVNLSAPKISYTTKKPSRQTISQDVSATGTLSPTDTVAVGSQISGTITEVFVDVNDRVKTGQILAKINPEKLNQAVENINAQLESANAGLFNAQIQLENKQWTYENYANLFEKTGGKSPSLLQLKTAELEFKSAKADIMVREAAIKQLSTQLNSAKIDVKNSIITSPNDGIVLSKSIEAGQTVAASFSTPTLFTIAKDLTKMKLVSNVLEADIGKVKIGQDVEFSVDAFPSEKFRAKVAKVNFADTSSSSNIISYEVTTFVENDALLLRPGMSASATIKTQKHENALVVPYQALLFKPNAQNEAAGQKKSAFMGGPPPREARKTHTAIGESGSLWVLENGAPREIEVKIGITNGRFAEILGGDLSEEAEVIIAESGGKK